MSANQFHNFGTIQTYAYQFFHNYGFNSGIIKSGEIPTEVADLTAGVRTSATPKFQNGVVENFGKEISKGSVEIRDGLSYHNRGETAMENLKMFGGDIKVQNGSLLISGKISGNVRDLSVSKNASFFAKEIKFSKIRNLHVEDGANVFSENPYSFEVTEKYENSGCLASLADLSLHLKTIPANQQSGILLAGNHVKYSYERTDKPKNSRFEPKMTEDPQMRRYLMSHRSIDFQGVEFQRKKEEFYGRKGFKPERDERTVDAINFVGKIISRKCKIKIYTDHYLNTITYHYVDGKLVNVTETGYVWQKRTCEEKEVPGSFPLLFDAFLKGFKNRMDAMPNQTEKLLKELESFDKKKKAERRKKKSSEFLDSLRAKLGEDLDVSSMLGDSSINAFLSNLRNFRDREVAKTPEIEALRKLDRDAVLDRPWWQKFFNPEDILEAGEPNLVERLVLSHPEILLGPASLGLYGLRTAGALALQRVAPRALALVSIAPLWENLVNYMKGGKDAVKKPVSGGTAPRAEREFGNGEYWNKLITDKRSAASSGLTGKQANEVVGRIERAKRFIKGQIRADEFGNLYKFDKAHQSSKVHLEKIMETKEGFVGVAEVDPVTGNVIKSLWRKY